MIDGTESSLHNLCPGYKEGRSEFFLCVSLKLSFKYIYVHMPVWQLHLFFGKEIQYLCLSTADYIL